MRRKLLIRQSDSDLAKYKIGQAKDGKLHIYSNRYGDNHGWLWSYDGSYADRNIAQDIYSILSAPDDLRCYWPNRGTNLWISERDWNRMSFDYQCTVADIANWIRSGALKRWDIPWVGGCGIMVNLLILTYGRRSVRKLRN